MRRLVLSLNAATVLLVVLGLVLLVAPSPMPSGGQASVAAATGGSAGDSVRLAPADVNAAERVVRSDIFSPRRSPPSRRYMYGDGGDQPDAGSTAMTVATPLAGEAVDTSSAATSEDAVPHLYGTMLGPNESTALLRLDANVAEPRLYRVGGRAGGYRVTEIDERSVTLAGSNGRVVLRLPRPNQ